MERAYEARITTLDGHGDLVLTKNEGSLESPVVFHQTSPMDVRYRVSGDKYLLVEYGMIVLDFALRFRVHALMTVETAVVAPCAGVIERVLCAKGRTVDPGQALVVLVEE